MDNPYGFIEMRKSASRVRARGVARGPAVIHIIYERDFESKPLWQIGRKRKNKDTGKWMIIGLGSWAEDKRGGWKKKDLRDTTRIKGLFLEIDSVKTSKGLHVLIEHEGKKSWVNVGEVKPGQECEWDSEKRKCRCNYRIKYRNATCYGPQIGVKGSFKVEYRRSTLNLKLLALREKRHQNGEKSLGWPYVGPGRYKGLVLAGEHVEKNYRVPVIQIHETWDRNKREWIKGCWTATREKDEDTGTVIIKRKRRKGKPKTTTSILIHPTNFPWKLEGCLAPGRNFSDYGFASSKDSREAMLDVFNLIWPHSSTDDSWRARKDELFKKLRKLTKSQRLKFIVKVTDSR